MCKTINRVIPHEEPEIYKDHKYWEKLNTCNPQEIEEEITDLYKTCGYSKTDTIELLKSICRSGYDLSYDESAGMFTFEHFRIYIFPCEMGIIPNS
jgi:hypothetical protein